MQNRKKGQFAHWFKANAEWQSTLAAIPNEDIGAGFKAAMLYFDARRKYKPVPPIKLSPLSQVVFATLQSEIDEAVNEYANQQRAGAIGIFKKRYKMDKINYSWEDYQADIEEENAKWNALKENGMLPENFELRRSPDEEDT